MASSIRLRPLLKTLQPADARSVVLYWTVAVPSSLLSTWIGSLSEYRLPHPMLTTWLHLLISLVTVLTLSWIALQLQRSSSRQLSSSKSTSAQVLDALIFRRPFVWAKLFSPLPLSTSMVALLAAIHEMELAKVAEQPFVAFVRLLPIFVLSLAPLRGTGDWPRTTALLVGLVLGAGPGVRVGLASGAAWWGGVVYAFSAALWVFGLSMGLKKQAIASSEAEPGEHRANDGQRPTLPVHFFHALLFLSGPVILSGDLGRASSSGHFGFFTSPGFWIQELGLAWCGLARLGVFWNLVRHVDPLSAILVVSIKDFMLPLVTSFWFGNPLIRHEHTRSALTTWQQALVLGFVSVSVLVAGPGKTRMRTW